MTDRKRKLIVAIIVLLSVFLVITGGLAAWYGYDSSSYSRHIVLAQKYLEAGDYNRAVLEYQAAIEKEPENEETYEKLADVYSEMGQESMAKTVLQKGVETTGSSRLADKRDVMETVQPSVPEDYSNQNNTPSYPEVSSDVYPEKDSGEYPSGIIGPDVNPPEDNSEIPDPEHQNPIAKTSEKTSEESSEKTSEEPCSEEPRSEEPHSEEPHSEEPRSEEPHSEEPRSEEPPSTEAPSEDDSVENYLDEFIIDPKLLEVILNSNRVLGRI